MNPEALRLFFRAGVFIILVSIVLIFANRRESAEFVVSVCSLGIGLALTGLVWFVSRLAK